MPRLESAVEDIITIARRVTRENVSPDELHRQWKERGHFMQNDDVIERFLGGGSGIVWFRADTHRAIAKLVHKDEAGWGLVFVSDAFT